MTDMVIEVLAGVAAGAAVGLAYFGGLLATVRRLRRTGGAGLLPLSLLLRLLLAATVLVVLARWSPLALLVALGGLLSVRIVMTRTALLDRWLPSSDIASPTDTARSGHG